VEVRLDSSAERNAGAMPVLVARVGLFSVLLVAAVRLAYLAVPSGRMCPRCGGGTSAVEFEGIGRRLERWIQRRWCSRCGWEGAGRRGPDVAPFENPVDHESGFRWRRRRNRAVPVFWWGDDSTDEIAREDVEPPSGTHRAEEEDRSDPDHRSGFHFRDPEETEGPVFEWGGERKESHRMPRSRGFRWRPPHSSGG